jgi:hypothetical protein
MQCIICHNDIMGLEFFSLHIRLRKYFIVYHKSNGITTMKKHVEIEQKTLINNSLKTKPMLLFFHLHVTSNAYSNFFVTTNLF